MDNICSDHSWIPPDLDWPVSSASALRPGLNHPSHSRPSSAALAVAAVPLWCILLFQAGSLKPQENWEWLPWLGVLACRINATSSNKWILGILYILFALLATWLLVPEFERLAPERPYWLIAVPLMLLVSLGSSTGLSHRLAGPALPFVLLLATFAAALLAFAAAIAKFAELGLIVTGMLAGCCVASFCFPSRPLTSAIAPGWSVLYPGFLIEAKLYSYSEVPLASYILLLCAPLTIWLTAIPPLRKMKPVWRTVLTLVLLLAPIAVGLYWAGQVAIEDVTDAEAPGWLLQILRRLLGKSPLTDLEE